MAGTGFEIPQDSSEKTIVSENPGDKTDALSSDYDAIPPDLASVVEAWVHLTEAERTQMLAVVQSSAVAAEIEAVAGEPAEA